MYEKAVITRPHGIHGEVIVKTSDNQPLDVNQVYYQKNQRGDFTPIRVERQIISQKGDELLFFVLFTGITNRQLAENLKGETIFTPVEPDINTIEEDQDPIYDTIGFKVVDSEGIFWGTVDDVTETAAHTILVITKNDSEYMLPAVEEHIIEINFETEEIVAVNPQEFASL